MNEGKKKIPGDEGMLNLSLLLPLSMLIDQAFAALHSAVGEADSNIFEHDGKLWRKSQTIDYFDWQTNGGGVVSLFQRSCFNFIFFGIIAAGREKQLRFLLKGYFHHPFFTTSIFTELKQAKNPLFIKVYSTFSTPFFNPKTTYCE